MSYVFSAFALAYAAFEIPSGRWGDRAGTRNVLTRIVCWWSAFTIATAAAFNYWSMLVIRFLFGAGEAGAWPNATKTLSRWFPKSERGVAQGIFFMGAHLSGGLTPLLVTFLLYGAHLHWRLIFVLFGGLGFVWAIAWYRWFRDDPAQHAQVSAAELAYIRGGRSDAEMAEQAATDSAAHASGRVWGQLGKSRNVWLLCLMYFTQTFGFAFYVTWLITFLKEGREDYNQYLLALLGGLPLLLSVPADLFGGLTTDAAARRYGLRAGRVGVGAASLLAAGALMISGGYVGQPIATALLISLAAAASNFLLGAAWGTCVDIGGGDAGVVSAAMNTAGQIGGILSPIVLERINNHYGHWTPALYVIGGLYMAGGLCWLGVDPRRAIAQR